MKIVFWQQVSWCWNKMIEFSVVINDSYYAADRSYWVGSEDSGNISQILEAIWQEHATNINKNILKHHHKNVLLKNMLM